MRNEVKKLVAIKIVAWVVVVCFVVGCITAIIYVGTVMNLALEMLR